MHEIYNINELLVKDNISLKESLEILDRTGKQVLLVTDSNNKLSGILTDGDVRRHLLKNGKMTALIKDVMNMNYKFLPEEDIDKLEMLYEGSGYHHIPILDAKGFVIKLYTDNKDRIKVNNKNEIPVVIMAGGRGTRLDPLTRIIPKPLIPVGDITMIEKIMLSFYEQGFYKFHLIVNHKKDLIITYLNGLELPYQIKFIEEKKFLGTAGGLKLLEGMIEGLFLLTNCDVLVKTNYQSFINWHKTKNADISILGVKTKMEMPYGILNIDEDSYVTDIKEKPNYHHFIISGLYLIKSCVFKIIPENVEFDMDKLLTKARNKDYKVTCFPIEEGWYDMGQFSEYQKLLMHLKVLD